MGILDKAKEMLGMDGEDAADAVDDAKAKAEDAGSGMADKMKAGVDKTADAADSATGGKASEHIDKGADTMKSGIDKVTGS